LKAGAISKNESVVVCITGNGYKTSNVMADRLAQPTQLGRPLREFEAFLADRAGQPANV
jgi:threonine synthase